MIIRNGFVRHENGDWHNLANFRTVYVCQRKDASWQIAGLVELDDGADMQIMLSTGYPTKDIATSSLDAVFGYVW